MRFSVDGFLLSRAIAQKGHMNDPQQIENSEAFHAQCSSLQVEYLAPRSEVVDEYSQRVCQALARKFHITDPNQHNELTRGFTNFVNIITQIHVKYLNQRGLHELQEIATTDTT
jgi:hypothetical protein